MPLTTNNQQDLLANKERLAELTRYYSTAVNEPTGLTYDELVAWRDDHIKEQGNWYPRITEEHAHELYQMLEPTVSQLVSKYRSMPGLDIDDIAQQARIWAWKAVNTYSPRKGTLVGYVRQTLDWRLGSLLKYTRNTQRHTDKIDSIHDTAPDRDELPVPDAGVKPAGHKVAKREGFKLIMNELNKLGPREAAVVKAHYFDGEDMGTVAKRYGLSSARISEIIAAAREQLQRAMLKYGIRSLDDIIDPTLETLSIKVWARNVILEAKSLTRLA